MTRSDVRYATTPGGSVAYQVTGEGPIDLVFIPEWWNETESMWDHPLLADVLERFASFSRLICFDRRGCGISDPIPLGATPVLDDWIDDLKAVMDAAGSERAVVVGCSGGGPLSVLFAATFPHRVAALVLVNSYARFSRTPGFEIGVPSEVVDQALELVHSQWGTGEHLDVLAPSFRDDRQLRRWWARYQRHSLSPGVAATIQRMLFEINVRDVLPAVNVPTLVLHRIDDPFVRLPQGRFLADHIPQAALVELPGADHVFFAGNSDELTDEIESFTTGTRGPARADRVLTTMLFTDIVGSTERAVAEGDRAWRTFSPAITRRSARHWSDPSQRGRHSRRWVFRHVRRTCTSSPMCGRRGRRRPRARPRDPGRRPHWGGGTKRIVRDRGRRPRRGPGICTRWPRRGAGHRNGTGPRRRIGTALRRSRQPPAQGRAWRVADPRCEYVAPVRADGQLSIRSERWTVTESPACLPSAERSSDFTGSLCRPSPRAMNELRKSWPSMVPTTLTSPRVPKNSAVQSVTT